MTSECYLLVHVMCQSAVVLHMHRLHDELFDSSLHEPSAKTSILKEYVFPNINDDSGLCPSCAGRQDQQPSCIQIGLLFYQLAATGQ